MAFSRADREESPQLRQSSSLRVAVRAQMPTGQLADILGAGQVVIDVLV